MSRTNKKSDDQERLVDSRQDRELFARPPGLAPVARLHWGAPPCPSLPRGGGGWDQCGSNPPQQIGPATPKGENPAGDFAAFNRKQTAHDPRGMSPRPRRGVVDGRESILPRAADALGSKVVLMPPCREAGNESAGDSHESDPGSLLLLGGRCFDTQEVNHVVHRGSVL